MTRSVRSHAHLLIVSMFCLCALVWTAGAQETKRLSEHVIEMFGEPPATPDGALPEKLTTAVQAALIEGMTQDDWGSAQVRAMEQIAASKDPRLAWIISDAVRFAWDRQRYEALTDAAAELLRIELDGGQRWVDITNHLIAWDLPAYPSYLSDKRRIFTHFVPGWERIFVEGDIDWRLVSWGGVHIDNRPFGETDTPCNCIPAADNPAVSTASEARWLKDDDIVFGIVVSGEARAYPRRIMEVREMVNDTLGGRSLGIPYCTLCGAAQAYFTDQLAEGIDRPVLRTSGLLIRSNKVMYDVNTFSVFDTFLGKAVTGPLAEKNVQLRQATVVTTDWATWKAAHPDTTVLIEELALGRDFDFRNGRDANGPIFPIGDVDPRLPVHEDIIGVIAASGTPVAFQRSTAYAALKNGQQIAFENVRLKLDAGGVRAVGADGSDLGSHQAFWFAWSQFYPGTVLWQQ